MLRSFTPSINPVIFGAAMAAMTMMIPITTTSSISEKPVSSFVGAMGKEKFAEEIAKATTA